MTLLGLHLVGHCHTEIGVVDEAVCEHKVDGDNRGQYVDLADKNKSHGEKAGQTDSCHRSLVWPFLLKMKTLEKINNQIDTTNLQHLPF